jgi:PPP family 3-phenylpropionic acid transporter
MKFQQVLPLSVSADKQITAFYILSFAAGGVIKPFLNLYLVEVGLGASQIGVIYGWASLGVVVLPPLIGLLADHTQRHRLILAVITVIKGLSAPLMLLSSAWGWLVLLVGTRVVTAGISDGLLTPLTLAYLKENNRQNLGAVRFWGALGFALTSLLAGWLARDTSVAILFPLAGLLGILAVPFVRALPQRISNRTADARPVSGLLPKSAHMWLLYAFVFLFAFTLSGPENFLNIHLVQGLGARNDFIGLIGAVLYLAPLAGYYLADKLIGEIGGALTMAISFFIYALTWFAYALIGRLIWALPLAILQGFGQALYIISMFILVNQIGSPERASTDVMLARVTVPGLACILAGPLSGWIYDQHGARMLFVLDGVIVLVATVLLLLTYKVLSIGQTGTDEE